jgi:hypothetical protein
VLEESVTLLDGATEHISALWSLIDDISWRGWTEET